MTRHVPAATLAALLLLTGSLRAQSSLAEVQLPPGAKVRLTVPSVLPERVTGRVLVRGGDSLTLGKDGGRVRLTFTSAQIEMLEVSRGRARWQWGLVGGAAGLLGGAMLGSWQGGKNDTNGLGAMVGFVGGAAVGLPVGAIAGVVLAPERWRRYRFAR